MNRILINQQNLWRWRGRYIKLLPVFLCMLLSTMHNYAQKVRPSSGGSQRSAAMIQVDSARMFVQTQPSRSFDYIEKALSLAASSSDSYAEAMAYQVLGMVNARLSLHDLSADYFRRAAKLLESLKKPAELYETKYLFAESLLQINNYDESMVQLNQALGYAKRENNKELELRCLNLLGELYAATGKTELARNMFESVLKEEQMRSNSGGVIAAQNRIGEIYQQEKQDAKAVDAYQQSAELSRSSRDNESLKKSLSKQGSALRNEKRYEEEKKLREELLDISRSENDISGEAQQNLEIGNILLEQNNTQAALPYIQKSVELADKGGNLAGKGEALRSLSSAYDQGKQYDKALQIYKQYVATMDAIHRKKEEEISENLKLVASLNRKLERLDMIEKDLQLSEKRLQLMEQERMVSKRELRVQRVFTGSLLAAFAGLGIAFFIIYRGIHQKRKANQILALQSLRSQMNPHFIFNSLNSVNSYISRNDERSANRYLSEFSRLMRTVMDHSKHDFIPLQSELEVLQLYLSLEHSRFSDVFDYSFTTDPALDPSEFKIPPMLVQPYIENAIWHGLRYREGKGFLSVNFLAEGEFLKVVVEDNGIGRSKSLELKTKHQQEHVSTGMKNIDNRLQLIRELFGMEIRVQITDLEPSTCSGTRVEILLPGK